MVNKTYVAKFSTSEVTRKSSHNYVSAAAYVNRETGEIKNVTFSGTIASASNIGLFEKKDPERRWFSSRDKWLRAIEENNKRRQLWKMEVVNLQILIPAGLRKKGDK